MCVCVCVWETFKDGKSNFCNGFLDFECDVACLSQVIVVVAVLQIKSSNMLIYKCEDSYLEKRRRRVIQNGFWGSDDWKKVGSK